MATLLSPQDALDYAKEMVRGVPLDRGNLGAQICDIVYGIMWTAASWSWSVGVLEQNLSSGISTYTVTLPSDYLYPVKARLLIDGTRKAAVEPLSIEASLKEAGFPADKPHRVMIDTAAGKIVLYPDVPTIPQNEYWKLQVLYKKKRTIITTTNLTQPSTLAFPDEWWYVFAQGVLWQAMLYTNNPSKGSSQTTNEMKEAYTGQMGVFFTLLNAMKEAEPTTYDWPGIKDVRP